MRISLRYVLSLLAAFGLAAPVAAQAQVTPERIERVEVGGSAVVVARGEFRL